MSVISAISTHESWGDQCPSSPSMEAPVPVVHGGAVYRSRPPLPVSDVTGRSWTARCRDGNRCAREDCKFFHGEQCRFGPRCRDPVGCRFDHRAPSLIASCEQAALRREQRRALRETAPVISSIDDMLDLFPDLYNSFGDVYPTTGMKPADKELLVLALERARWEHEDNETWLWINAPLPADTPDAEYQTAGDIDDEIFAELTAREAASSPPSSPPVTEGPALCDLCMEEEVEEGKSLCDYCERNSRKH